MLPVVPADPADREAGAFVAAVASTAAHDCDARLLDATAVAPSAKAPASLDVVVMTRAYGWRGVPRNVRGTGAYDRGASPRGQRVIVYDDGGDAAGGSVQLARFMAMSKPRVVLLGPGPSTRATSESAPTRRYVIFRGKSCAGFSKTSVVGETDVDRKSA